MNKQESLKLFSQGRDAWNAWAEERLAERRTLEATGDWVDDLSNNKWNDATRNWHEAATADFSGHEFEAKADFSGFNFPGLTWFQRVTFSDDAWFNEATFRVWAQFDEATFLGDARFHKATFSDDAWFTRTAFSRGVWFKETTFSGDAKFNEASFAGNALFEVEIFSRNTSFQAAIFSGYAFFRGVPFSGYTWFNGAAFAGEAWFGGASFAHDAQFTAAKFESVASFDEAGFNGKVIFQRAIFKDRAEFSNATFLDSTGFEEAVFAGIARFEGATFSGPVNFLQSCFDGFTSFDGCRFEETTSYRAIQVSKAFSLAQARFCRVPNLIQARFAEAPQLDNIHIETQRLRPSDLANVKALFKGDIELESRWRALRKLAAMAHDHDREQLFFRGELLARRCATDKPWHAAFWCGLLYGLLSNFGRSLVRPVFCWVFVSLLFACLYLNWQVDLAARNESGMAWAFERIGAPLSGGPDPVITCARGGGDPLYAALYLSLLNGLPFPGIGSSETLNQIYACLYGAYGGDLELPARFRPLIPDGVAFLSVLQTLCSAVLVFCFLLALRNHFRIK